MDPPKVETPLSPYNKNIQAGVTGKLKQHFNNALPKQNSTTTGVSVIMVSGMPSFGWQSWGLLAWLLSWSCLLN